VDVDPVDMHLIGYGHTGLPADHIVYQKAIPRLLGIFDRVGVRATFFIVGRDAADNPGVLRAIVEGGHEVASHSYTHPMSFGRLTDADMHRELDASRQALESAGAGSVVGFRAPNFDVDKRVVGMLNATGYRYDASGYPTPLLIPVRTLLALKSRDPASVFSLSAWPFTMKREPFVWSVGNESVHEFPTSVTRWTRMPVYHTMRYYIGEKRFVGKLDGLAGEGHTLSYPLHGVDALGLSEDAINPLLSEHPGMKWELRRKLDMLEASLEHIVARFESLSFRDQLELIEQRAVA
jgi:hypothetical protein